MIGELRGNLTSINLKLDELGQVLSTREIEINSIRSEYELKIEESNTKFIRLNEVNLDLTESLRLSTERLENLEIQFCEETKALAIAKNVIDSQKIENQNLEEENGRIIAEKTESLAKIGMYETELSKLQAILEESEAKNHILESEKIENLKDIEELQ